jgi:hypothetical protein
VSSELLFAKPAGEPAGNSEEYAMDEDRRSVPGSCSCGAVRFAARLPSLFCAHCHCSMCRRHHGAAFVTWFGVPRAELRILAGNDRLVRNRSSDHGTRSFCGVCGSSLFFETTRHPERVDIALANMVGPIDREPQLHVYFSDRAPWVSIDDSLPRLGGTSGFEPIDT